MRGITKKVALKLHENSGVLEDTRGDSQVVLTGTTKVNRQDFGIKGERWGSAVADEIEIELTFLCKRINESNFRNWVRNEERPQGKIYKTISESGVAAGLAEFDKMKSSTETEINANALNTAGYMLLKEARGKEVNELKKAAEIFRMAIEKNPQNANAIEILRHLPSQ